MTRLETCLLLMLLATACKDSPEPLKIQCGEAFRKPLEQTKWKDADLIGLRDGSETLLCADDDSVELYFSNQAVEAQQKRIVDLLLAKGYHEIDPSQAAGKVAVKRDPKTSGVGLDGYTVLIAPRLFATDRDEISVSGTVFPKNAGKPFDLSIARSVK
jgi:hypothetical protein